MAIIKRIAFDPNRVDSTLYESVRNGFSERNIINWKDDFATVANFRNADRYYYDRYYNDADYYRNCVEFNKQVFTQLGLNIDYDNLDLNEVRKLAAMTAIKGRAFSLDPENEVREDNKKEIVEAISLHLVSNAFSFDENWHSPPSFVNIDTQECYSVNCDAIDAKEKAEYNVKKNNFSFWKKILNAVFGAYADEKAEYDKANEKLKQLEDSKIRSTVLSEAYSDEMFGIMNTAREKNNAAKQIVQEFSWGDPTTQTYEERSEILDRIGENAHNRRVSDADIAYLNDFTEAVASGKQFRDAVTLKEMINEENLGSNKAQKLYMPSASMNRNNMQRDMSRR